MQQSNDRRGDDKLNSGKAREQLLIATSTFPVTADDGMPRFILDLATALTRHFRVTVLAPDAPGAETRESWGELTVRRFTYFRPRRWQRLAYGYGMRNNLRSSPPALLQVIPFVARQVAAIRSLCAREGIRCVNSHWMVPQGLSAALARGRRAGFRHVLHVHAADVYLLQKLPLGRALARYVMSRTDAVFADGSHVRDTLDELLGQPSEAVIQSMGVRAEFFRDPRPPPEKPPFRDGYLVFLGRFVEKKGAVFLLRAMPRVRRDHQGLGLILVGYGPLERELRKEMSRLGLEEAVSFAGRRSHEEVVGYLQNCRVAVVPSIIDSAGETEGMPTVVLEAMAAGARVVGSAVDGIPDVLRHRENGWLCRPADPEDLAEKILMALEDPTPSRAIEEGVRTAAGQDWREVAARYEGAIRRLLPP